MNISQASLEELRYYVILGRDLGYIQNEIEPSDLDDVARMLAAYIRTVKAPSS